MTPSQKLILIVDNAKGDDLERALMSFGKMSDGDLDQQYYVSGKTCREILNGYKRERAEWQAARDLLVELLGIVR